MRDSLLDLRREAERAAASAGWLRELTNRTCPARVFAISHARRVDQAREQGVAGADV